jgi:NAD(P)H-hydrate epimerase
MITLPHSLFTAAQTQEIDRLAIEEHGIAGSELMARAGEAALSTIKSHWKQANRILILCGTGNNGGDGFELARQALDADLRVFVYELGSINDLNETAAAARAALLEAGVEINSFTSDALRSADVIVDALFGTGLDRNLPAEAEIAIQMINDSRTPVLSLDLPSGLHPDTGIPMPIAMHATITLSFSGLNQGLFTGFGPDYVGEIVFNSLQIPPAIYNKAPKSARRVGLEDFVERLSPRQRTGHKGLYGHLLIIGGNHGMPGAPRMAAEAGARVGAGLISIATRPEHATSLSLTRPELMCYGVEKADDLDPLLERCNAIAIGPGLGQCQWGQDLLDRALASKIPIVIDADALNLISKKEYRHDHWIITPHPGEAARLLNKDNLEQDRFDTVKELQKAYGGVTVLKGASTIINAGEPDPLTRLSIWGNPGMATGGMGDVLTGTIGGLLAQGISQFEAACLGVTLHGMAGDQAVQEDGERGLLASDLMPYLRRLSNLIYAE